MNLNLQNFFYTIANFYTSKNTISDRELEKFKHNFKKLPFYRKKGFINEFAKNISTKKSFDLFKGIYSDTLLLKDKFIDIDKNNESYTTNENTIFISNVNTIRRLYGEISIGYDLVPELRQSEEIVGDYLYEFNIAFIEIGNHRCTVCDIFGKAILKTNTVFKPIKINNNFLDTEIEVLNMDDFFTGSMINKNNKDIVFFWVAIQMYLKEERGIVEQQKDNRIIFS